MEKPEGKDPILSLRNLSFRYPRTISGRSITALQGISLDIFPGEFTVVTGPSGSGKSTLARCLNGLIPHAAEGSFTGDVIVAGRNTKEHDVPDLAESVGMVFQDPGYQIVTGDVESEIAFGLEIRNVPEQEMRGRVKETLQLLHIGHLAGRAIRDLSWGERQRVAIASILTVRPSVVVMDEPFSGLDAAAGEGLSGLLSDLKRNSGTTIIVFEHRTHPLRTLADRWVVLEKGKIVYSGSPGGVQESGAPEEILVREASFSPVTDPSLALRNVTFRYPGMRVPALENVSLAFYPGDITILSGPNGSGKTTLLKHLNGLHVPDSGEVLLGNSPINRMTVAEIARNVGLLNQHADYQIFESTIAEELAFGPRNLGKPEQELAGIVEKARTLCSLDHIDPGTPPLGLSGGEKQRVALAGILAMDTPVIVLDEPTFGLDPVLKTGLILLLQKLRDLERTVIVATHDAEFARMCGNRFVRIASGRVESDSRSPCREDRNG